MHELRFRQVHLDFHTSPKIDRIGERFDKKYWQDTLKSAHIDSITCFSMCHHGYSYHPTKVSVMHPGLKFNLLREQIDACHEIDIKVPVYLTAGLNNRLAEAHPEWREVNPDGKLSGWTWSNLTPGFKKLCFNSPYLDELCRCIEEAVTLFPDGDGIFLDIISQGQCCCEYCMRDMLKEGYNPESEEDRKRFSIRTLMKYYKATTAAARIHDSKMPVFHNGGGGERGNHDVLPYFSHLELESLPTGGWGYDHFPLTAAWCRTLKDKDFLGMTGKFHTAWGEFGGFKHPNALRYECAAMIANGAKCSIGDQLHPDGQLDASTYKSIGAAYAEVEAKEPWCSHVKSMATVGLVCNTAFDSKVGQEAEIGASRLLLEEHIPFDNIDKAVDWKKYKVVIIADDLRIDADLKKRIDAFLDNGGKLILSNASLLKKDEDKPAFNIGAKYEGDNDQYPDYLQVAPEFAAPEFQTPFVMYQPAKKIKVTKGKSLGDVYYPYFNRTFDHFCSHRQTPYQPDPSGYHAGSMTKNILYFANPVFKLYGWNGSVCLKYFIRNAMRAFMNEDIPVQTSLPSQGRLTLMNQPEKKRVVLHLLYANMLKRGSYHQYNDHNIDFSYDLELIEELNPYYNVKATVNVGKTVKSVTLEPQGKKLPFKKVGKGIYEVLVPEVVCHQMVVFHY